MEPIEQGEEKNALGAILLGPGPRLDRLGSLLSRLGVDLAWRRIADLAELLNPAPAPRLLLLDVDQVAAEDLGLPLRALERHPGVVLGLVGSDAGTTSARRLLAQPGATWLAWPLDLEQLERLLSPSGSGARVERRAAAPSPGPAADPQTPPRAHPPAGPRTPEEDALRRQVEDILGAPARTAPPGRPLPEPAPRAAAATAVLPALPQQPQAAEPPRPAAQQRPTEPQRGAAAPPPVQAPWFRHQVADLADVVQRAELGLAQVRAAAEGAVGGELEERLDRLGEEFVRLVQFTRTLGYLVAAPGPGSQRIEFGGLLEAQLRTARSEADCPRFLFRSTGDLWVRSERALLTEALDALLGLAQLCAGPEGTVRVEVQAGEPGDRSVEARLSFPVGPLGELPLERILEPYGLRRILPDLGANALCAARGILEGQGGGLELRKLPDATLEWRLHLPQA